MTLQQLRRRYPGSSSSPDDGGEGGAYDSAFDLEALDREDNSDDSTSESGEQREPVLDEDEVGCGYIDFDEEAVEEPASTAVAPSAFAEADEDEDDSFESAASIKRACVIVGRSVVSCAVGRRPAADGPGPLLADSPR